MNNRLIKSNDAGGGACTNTVDLYNPFPDGGGVALYQLNGDATDVSGNYNGTASNVTYGAGQFGQAGVFNGSSSYVSNSSSLTSGNNPFSVSVWVNTTSTGVFFFLGNSTVNDSLNVSFYISVETGGAYSGNVRVGNFGTDLFTSSTSVDDGNWHHIAFTSDGITSKLYIDGTESNTTLHTWAISAALIEIGRGTSSYYFNGSIDQVRIFNRALRPYEVEALYTEEYCTPTIVPSEHFNTVLYDGTGGSKDITNVGFAPDLTWVKSRGSIFSTDNHNIYDSIRGANYALFSDLTIAENYNTQRLQSFLTNGFTIGDQLNVSGGQYVSWNFKAGGAAVTNTDGTITSQVSANTEAGFSIVSWTSNDNTSDSVGHGLGVTPDVYIVKKRNNTSQWYVYAQNIIGNNTLKLNTTDAVSSSGWISAPTETTFNAWDWSAGSEMITYCFAEVEGFSNFGSYVGTGAAGNTIVTGFEPAFLIVKEASTAGSWFMIDNKRGVDKRLLANVSDAEGAISGITFLENGFGISGGLNSSSTTYIYMAFAADPTAVEPSLEDSFNTVTYTGNRGTKEVTGIGFQPDFIWLKNRDAIASNFLHDTVRGINNNYYECLISNGTFSESTTNQAWHDSYGRLSAIYDGGFTVNQGTVIDDPSYNNTQDYVAWCWKGAEIPAINSNGSIPSVVSANPAAGFSIVSWNGIGAAQSIGHGLDAVPSIIIQKRRTVGDWEVYTSTTGANQKLLLNSTAAAASSTAFGNTTPTSSVYYAGAYADPMIAYCFAEVAGFSKFGSYTGTGASGNTVTLGFEPAFLLIKRTDVAGNSWLIADNKRDTTNPIELFLAADTSQAEFPITSGIDFNANDFTLDSANGSLNASGGTYIYMAFANQF